MLTLESERPWLILQKNAINILIFWNNKLCVFSPDFLRYSDRRSAGSEPVRRAVTVHLTSVLWTVTWLTLATSIVVRDAALIN